MIDVDSMELTLNLRVCLCSKHRLWGLRAVNAWMMICQGVRTRFLVYDDEWATLPPHAMFSISRLSLWLPAAQTLPSRTALPARLTVIQSPHEHTPGWEPKPLPWTRAAGGGAFTQQSRSLFTVFTHSSVCHLERYHKILLFRKRWTWPHALRTCVTIRASSPTYLYGSGDEGDLGSWVQIMVDD